MTYVNEIVHIHVYDDECENENVTFDVHVVINRRTFDLFTKLYKCDSDDRTIAMIVNAFHDDLRAIDDDYDIDDFADE